MSDKSEQQESGRKPEATEHIVETDGAFGNNPEAKLFSGDERNLDKASEQIHTVKRDFS